MSKNAYNLATTTVVAFFISVVIGGLILTGLYVSNKNNQKDLKIRLACIAADKQVIDGNCIQTPKVTSTP